MMRKEDNLQRINITSSSSSSSTKTNSCNIRCQDCGNQAKKDCNYLRCRTCCKARGFQCQTHIKSTWIPVSRRRPRELIMHHHHHQIPPPALHRPNPKRCREIHPLQLGFQEGIFPVETSFPAVFRCVRVSTVDNVEDQYAYQTSVNIGGHIFTGILYDHGPEPEGTGHYVTGESSNSGGTGSLHQPDFVTRTTATGTITSSPSPFCAFTTSSSQFFQYPKS